MKIDRLVKLKNAACNACDVAWEATSEARKARDVAWDNSLEVDVAAHKVAIAACDVASEGNTTAAWDDSRDAWDAYEVARDAYDAAYNAAFLIAYNDSHTLEEIKAINKATLYKNKTRETK